MHCSGFSEVQLHTSWLKKRQWQPVYGSGALATLLQGSRCSHSGLCACAVAGFLPPPQPAVFLAVNPLLQVKRSKESLDCSLDSPRVFNFKSLCPQHLPPWKVLHAPSHPAKPDSFLLYSTPSAGWRRASTFTGFISACGVAYISYL